MGLHEVIRAGYLSEFFSGIGAKRLSAVEALPNRSNQHELNGVQQLRRVFGDARATFPASFVYLGENDEAVFDSGFVTWYDAREYHPTRSEYRLYFPTTSVSERASEGDLAVCGLRRDDTVLIAIVQGGSSWEQQIRWLFGLQLDILSNAQAHAVTGEADPRLGFAARQILEGLGIEPEVANDSYLDMLLQRFGGTFPKTAIFSAVARESLPDVSPLDDTDAALTAWMEQEEMLFRTLERHLVEQRLATKFDGVDDFIQYSLSVHNRRKTRVGHALEHHLSQIFDEFRIRYSRGAQTENKSKPDFVFPGITDYRNLSFPTERLTVLAAKSTCKDRWRQVLAEALRVSNKHLVTLEPAISENQTAEMMANDLQLVVPASIQVTYSPRQREWLMDVRALVQLLLQRQNF